MKIIVCTGDSHTWGQGASGATMGFNPPLQGGDLRPVSFDCGCYVNLVRNSINKATGSSCRQELPDAEINGRYQTKERCTLARFFTVDGSGISMSAVVDGHSVCGPLKAEADADGIVLISDNPCRLYRAEYYYGDYAVVNAGIGSTTSQRYLQEYFASYVAALQPYCIIAEAHSINDWINRLPLDNVKQNLEQLLASCKRSMLLTVAPIDGTTTLPFNELDFTQYIQVSYAAAEAAGVPVADGNKAVPFGLFDDCWHVNDEGHRLYSAEILRVLGDMLPELRLK